MSVATRRLSRRRFIRGVMASGISLVAASDASAAGKDNYVNDASSLNPVRVREQRAPQTTEEVQESVRSWPGTISIGGGRYSMGGQIAAAESLHLDMRSMNRVLSFDPALKTIRVQAGITWRDLQDAIDPHELSVKIMQSYSNFTVGGSISVNCHGRYVGLGPVINSVRSIRMVTAGAGVLELDRNTHPELFKAACGGYGGLGVVTEVELDLAENSRIRRVVQQVSLAEYPDFFRSNIASNPDALLHNADLLPPDFDTPRPITWLKTEQPVTLTERLVPRDLDYTLEKNAIWAITELPGGRLLRDSITANRLGDDNVVVWRNHEASLDADSLEPRTRKISTYLLQEFFIPVKAFLPFTRRMAEILKIRDVNVLNISIRHSPPDTASLLTWAPTEVFSFVLYYKLRNNRWALRSAREWTRELIDAALAHGGRYYLPYRLDATRAQFLAAYPEAVEYARLKADVDPENRFRNLLWDRYLPET